MVNFESKEKLNIEIVLATPEDARVIKEVQYKAWLETYPNEEFGVTVDDVEDRYKDTFTDENIKKSEERIRNLPSNQRVLVAKENNQIVGFCILIKSENQNHLQALYVLPGYQGRGVGKLLWKEAQTFFDPNKNSIVDVATYNSNAIDFYKKLGFKDTGIRREDEKFRMKSGAIIPEMEMVIETTGK